MRRFSILGSIVITLLSLLMINSYNVLACDTCSSSLNLNETISGADVIIIAKKVYEGPNTTSDLTGGPDWIILSVTNQLKGTVPSSVNVNSWDATCPYGIVLGDNKEYVMFLEEENGIYNSVDNGCSVKTLRYDSGIVLPDGRNISLDEFKNLIAQVLQQSIPSDLLRSLPLPPIVPLVPNFTDPCYGQEIECYDRLARNLTQQAIRQQCNDSIDNDNDTKIDYPDDLGCSNYTDNNETDAVQQLATGKECNDSMDNDNDGKVDYPDDPDCASAEDDNETLEDFAPTTQCNDQLDNDGDGSVDYPDDPGCASELDNKEAADAPPPVPAKKCDDEVDNDNDGKVDMDDPGCDNLQDDDEYDAVTSAEESPDMLTSPLMPGDITGGYYEGDIEEGGPNIALIIIIIGVVVGVLLIGGVAAYLLVVKKHMRSEMKEAGASSAAVGQQGAQAGMMPGQSMQRYFGFIENGIKMGASEDGIRSNLLKSGWNQAQITELFEEYKRSRNR